MWRRIAPPTSGANVNPMSTSYSLTALEVWARPRGGSDETDSLPLNAVFPGGDLFNLATEFIDSLPQDKEHEGPDAEPAGEDGPQEYQRQVLLATRSGSHGRALFGMVQAGDTGTLCPVYDLRRRRRTGLVLPHQAVVQPFLFRLDLPTNARRGLLLLQRTGVHGIQSLFLQEFEGFFRERAKGHGVVLRVERLAPAEIIKYWREAEKVSEVRFTLEDPPPQLFERLAGDRLNSTDVYVQVVVRARRDREVPWLTQMRDSLTDPQYAQRLIRIPAGPDGVATPANEHPQVSFKVLLNGSERMLNVNNQARIDPSFEISVEIGADGHPTYASLLSASDTIAMGIAQRMGIDVPNVVEDRPQ